MNGVAIWKTPAGWMRIVVGERGLSRLEFYPCKRMFAEQVRDDEPDAEVRAVLTEARRQIDAYFAGDLWRFDLPLDLSAMTPFARRVLEALRQVPLGSTVTYGELASAAAAPGAARAVGRVMAANPLPIVIPCHRVVPAAGGLGSYSGGAGQLSKRRLLEHEGASVVSGPGGASSPRVRR